MKPIRWSRHAVENLDAREIDRSDAEATLADPEIVVPDPPGREILMRRYFDRALQQDMLLRVVLEEAERERVVVPVYKTSQIGRYWKERQP